MSCPDIMPSMPPSVPGMPPVPGIPVGLGDPLGVDVGVVLIVSRLRRGDEKTTSAPNQCEGWLAQKECEKRRYVENGQQVRQLPKAYGP
jgi:hypothetical protein